MTASKWKVCTGVEDRLMLTATTGWMFCCYSSGPEPASLPSAAELLLASSTDSGRVRLEHANVLARVSDVLVWCPSMFGFRHIIFHQLKLHAALNGPSHDPKFKMDNFLFYFFVDLILIDWTAHAQDLQNMYFCQVSWVSDHVYAGRNINSSHFNTVLMLGSFDCTYIQVNSGYQLQ